MKIGMLGTGVVGRTLGSKLVDLGHQVRMGSRSASNESARGWVAETGDGASAGTYGDAAAFGEMAFNCTKGEFSLDAVRSAGADSLRGKVLVDVSNPLDFSKGMPPSLTVCNTDSLGEQIQRELPDTRVVKALNTMWCGIMVDPRMLPGAHHTFLSGNDARAKEEVASVLRSFGWRDEEIVDLGDIGSARGTEMYLGLWVRIYGTSGAGAFNIRIVRPGE